MSTRIIEFFTCNLCGVEKQGPQSWHRYGVTDITSEKTFYKRSEYHFDIHVCHECYSENVPTMQKKIMDWIFKVLKC